MPKNKTLSHWRYWAAGLLALQLVLLLFLTRHGASGWQDAALAAGANAVLSRGSLALEGVTFGSGDLMQHDGVILAAKLPMMQVVGAAMAWLPLRILNLDLAVDHHRAFYWLTLLTSGAASLATLALLLNVGRKAKCDPWQLVLGVGGLGFGSIFLAHSMTFYYHVPSALLTVAALMALARATQGSLALAGALCGLLFAIDIPAALALGPCLLGGVAVVDLRDRCPARSLAFVVGGGVGLLPYAGLNLWQLGTLLPYHADVGLFDFEGSLLLKEDGSVGGLTREWPLWAYVVWATVGAGGLLSLSPIAGLWLLTAVRAARKVRPSDKADLPSWLPARVVLAFCVLLFLLCVLGLPVASASSYGQRMLVPVLAALAWLFVRTPWSPPSATARYAGIVLLLVSVGMSFPGVFSPFIDPSIGGKPPQAFDPTRLPRQMWPLLPTQHDWDMARGLYISADSRLQRGDAHGALPLAREAASRYPALGRMHFMHAQCLALSGSEEYTAIHQALLEARAKGYPVPEDLLNQAAWMARGGPR